MIVLVGVALYVAVVLYAWALCRAAAWGDRVFDGGWLA